MVACELVRVSVYVRVSVCLSVCVYMYNVPVHILCHNIVKLRFAKKTDPPHECIAIATDLTRGSDNSVCVSTAKSVDVFDSLLNAVHHFHGALLATVLFREVNTLRGVDIL